MRVLIYRDPERAVVSYACPAPRATGAVFLLWPAAPAS